MSGAFLYTARVQPAWIDYNGHMQDAYYGLIFSHAVDALQDAVGFDAAYRAATGCTIYLLEDHKRFLHEVGPEAQVTVRTHVINVARSRFHLWAEMMLADTRACVAEMVQMHVRQRPTPKSAPIPDAIARRLAEACLPAETVATLPCRARAMGL